MKGWGDEDREHELMDINNFQRVGVPSNTHVPAMNNYNMGLVFL